LLTNIPDLNQTLFDSEHSYQLNADIKFARNSLASTRTPNLFSRLSIFLPLIFNQKSNGQIKMQLTTHHLTAKGKAISEPVGFYNARLGKFASRVPEIKE
jgi:hypothetical protein